MPSKTLTIREEVYKKLLKIKKPNESFSELLERLAEKEASLQSFLKAKGSLDFGGKIDEIINEIYERRKE